ncbi:egg bindin receptor protein 1 precursor [Apostichopus japonicus]|uniref:Egg bindin receptor protein 1 n=1 Tax=Stichopus japonicus TaxID=307972 RepID=A0A2G8LP43_STIJA|nr:egg bindin receptor protein 1 precursor [Apostichopus japonicus]
MDHLEPYIFLQRQRQCGSGYRAFVAFVDCTVEYAYRVGNFSECDATCGEAVQMRDVDCIEISSGDIVEEALCLDEAPESLLSTEREILMSNLVSKQVNLAKHF